MSEIIEDWDVITKEYGQEMTMITKCANREGAIQFAIAQRSAEQVWIESSRGDYISDAQVRAFAASSTV